MEDAGPRRTDGTHQVDRSSGTMIGNGNTQINLFHSQTISQDIPGPTSGMASNLDRMSRVAYWGATGSGKSTYLAALNLAARDARPPWTITGADPSDTGILTQWTIDIVRHREFPLATTGIEHINFRMTGRTFAGPVQFDLEIVDPTGELFRPDQAAMQPREQLVNLLQGCDGIVLFFDPVRESRRHDAYDKFQSTAAQLEHRLGIRDGDRLPHHVAVVIAKYDDPRVLATAQEAGYLARDPDDHFAFPLVDDERAAGLLDELYRRSNPGSGDLFRRTIEGYFHQDRIRYFAVSSIGFHLDGSRIFNWDDYYNIIQTDRGGWMLRGDIRPINVLEPMLWLAAPDLYTALIQSRRRFSHLRQGAQETRPVRQRRKIAKPASAAGAPSRIGDRRPGHLIWLVEAGSQEDLVRQRLERVSQITSMAFHQEPGLRVSLISYGSHSFSSCLPEEFTEVLAWGDGRATVMNMIDRMAWGSVRESRKLTYALSAQVECALAEVARRLNGSSEVAAVVTVGRRPASPPRMAGESLSLPCPVRNDWRKLIRELRDNHTVILGSIQDGNSNHECWHELGAHAQTDLYSLDVRRFAASLGLVDPDQSFPDPVRPEWSATNSPRGAQVTFTPSGTLRLDPSNAWLVQEPPTLPDLLAGTPESRVPLNWEDDE
jgi:energy-coupling factor transporter ATP-binding protein EcfA2